MSEGNCKLVQFKLNVRASILEYLVNTYGIDNFPHEVRTTRLDTDNLISKDFFDKINSVVLDKNTSQLLVSFPGGANYDVGNRVILLFILSGESIYYIMSKKQDSR